LPAALREPGDERAALDQAIEARLRGERERAWQEGERAGRESAAAQLEAQLARMVRSIEELARYKPRLRSEAERDVVSLALAVARRVLRRQIEIDPDAIQGLVRAALDRISLREVLEVRAAAQHAPAIRAVLERMSAPQAVVVQDDASLEPGAVMIRTAQGWADASVETQLEEIERGFADRLGGRR
jgi:flagellar assembly protein FliH